MDKIPEKYEHPVYKHQEDESKAECTAFAFTCPTVFKKFPYDNSKLESHELKARVLYTGLCQSDVHHGRGHWGKVPYPVAPGHEVIAEVTELGSDQDKFNFKVGDVVGFGPFRYCCDKCEYCLKGNDNMCQNEPNKLLFGKYFGGYSTHIQQPMRWAFKIPEGMPLDVIPPLLCAGATVWTPMTRHANKGDVIGVLGIGGLGHLAIKMAHSLGHKVIGFTSTSNKVDFIKELGADEVCVTSDEEQLKKYEKSLNIIVNTLSSGNCFKMICKLMKPLGKVLQVGFPAISEKMEIGFGDLIAKELSIIGGAVSTYKETQEMIDYCAKNKIYSKCEQYSFEDFPKALDKLENGKPNFRCVVNCGEYSNKVHPKK